jgi:hypothetical protein
LKGQLSLLAQEERCLKDITYVGVNIRDSEAVEGVPEQHLRLPRDSRQKAGKLQKFLKKGQKAIAEVANVL